MRLPEQADAYGMIRDAMGRGNYEEAAEVCTLVSTESHSRRNVTRQGWWRTRRSEQAGQH